VARAFARRLRLPGALRLVVLLALTAGLVIPVAKARASVTSVAPTPTFSDANGIHVVAVTPIDDRQYNVRVLSAALGRAVDVRILLPTDYTRDSTARFPVLYLFHGTSGRASDWVKMGDAEATTAPLQLITVMPDAGFDGDGGSWFTNWVDTSTQKGPSRWETFHVTQLIPWVDANLRTVAKRRGRAIAGLSQGGFGSMTYAARHPDTFVAAASFSGAPEIDRDPDVIIGATAVIEATAVGLNQTQPEAMFGSRVTNEINWQGHDPSTLMTNLRGMGLFLWTATGMQGPYDTSPNPSASGIEYLTHVSTQHFHDHLIEAGIPSYYNDYVNGTHTWPYWARDLRQFVGPMMATFARPPAPATISYKSVDAQWTQWGWTVSLARPEAQQFSSLYDAGLRGFTLAGAGAATVTTPAVYKRGSVVSVTVAAPAGTTTTTMKVDRSRRLKISFQLSAPLLGVAAPTGTARVTIQAKPRT
jgi:S-formylglutathione hydrolase FrmB